MTNHHAVLLKLMGVEASCLVCTHFSGTLPLGLTPPAKKHQRKVFCGSSKEYVQIDKAPRCPGFTPKKEKVMEAVNTGKEK